MPAKRLITLFLCFVVANFANAKNHNYQFEHLSLERGLSQSTVFAILQDRYGFLWFGTANGLNLYDGYTFKIYTHNPNDTTSISSDYINTLIEDSKGDLWIGTTNGLNRFDRKTQTFSRYQHVPNDDQSLNSNTVQAIQEDGFGALWVGTNKGLNIFDKKRGSLQEADHRTNPLSESVSILKILQDRQGNVWVGTLRNGVYRIQRDALLIDHYFASEEPLPGSLSHSTVYEIFEDSRGVIWIGTPNGLNRFNAKTKTFVTFKSEGDNRPGIQSTGVLLNSNVNCMAEDKDGKLWIGTNNGISVFEPASETFVNLTYDPNNPESLSANSIKAVLADRSGTIWIGTVLGGLNKFSWQRNQFQRQAPKPLVHGSSTDNRVYAFCEARDGLIVVGTWSGLVMFDPVKNKITTDHRYQKIIDYVGTSLILALHVDSENTLWIGTEGNGLFTADLSSTRINIESIKQYIHEPSNRASVSANRFRKIYEDRDGQIWIGTYGGGLNKFDRNTETFLHCKHKSSGNFSVSGNEIKDIFEDNQGLLWLATEGNGLTSFDRQNTKFTYYKHLPEDNFSISHNSLTAIYEDANQDLWVGTYGGGFNKFDRQNNKFIRYTEAQGLPNNVVYGILPDNQEHLWLSTNMGIARFNPVTETFANYDIEDGLQSNEFNTGAAFKAHNGRLYFGGVKGFNAFVPDDITQNQFVPPVLITSVKIFEKPLSNQLIFEEPLKLGHKENSLSFSFVGLEYTNPNKNQYAYMLEGLDPDWLNAGSRKFANYTNLVSGHYRFHVKASNSDGIWNNQDTFLEITITPPWWQTWWFRLLSALVLIFLALGIYKIRVRTLENQKRRLETLVEDRTRKLKQQKRLAEEAKDIIAKQADKLLEMDEAKSRFFTNISHEFRTPLTLILGPAQQLLSENENPEKQGLLRLLHRNAQLLLRLINQLLDLAKLEANQMKLQVQPNDLVRFFKDILLSFASLAECHHIVLQLKSEEKILVYNFDPDNLEKVVYNLVSNALKSTPRNGRITITLDKKEPNDQRFHLVEIKVADTGKGIEKSKVSRIFERFYQIEETELNGESIGIGLSLTKELVEFHGGEITVASEIGKGTEFTITLPLQPAELDGPESHRHNLKQIPPETVGLHTDEPETLESRDGKDKPLVLVIDDNSDILTYIHKCLSKTSTAILARDGVEGIEKAFEVIPDLIISDVMMPKMDGRKLCRILKNDKRTCHIPIILLTAKAEFKDKVEGLEVGADDYLMKPFEMEELNVRIKNLISQRKKLQAQFQESIFGSSLQEITSLDKKLLDLITRSVMENLTNEAFNAIALSKSTGMSLRQLQRKLKALTDQSPNQLIRSLRLERAKLLIQQEAGSITEIAFMVGFNSLSYFSKCFRAKFGRLPSECEKNSD